MKKVLKDILLLIVIALAVALIVNSVSPHKIPIKGTWYDNRHPVELETPPSYDPKTDSLLTMEEAFMLWKDKAAVFIDAREHDEYCEGHIKGAINLPFEEWDDYWNKVAPYLTSPDTKIVCYCGGLDCELSLFAARELKAMGYKNAYIFFGGYNAWIKYNLPWEKSNGE